MDEYLKYENMDLNELDNEDLVNLFEGMVYCLNEGWGFDGKFSMDNIDLVREILLKRMK